MINKGKRARKILLGAAGLSVGGTPKATPKKIS